MLKELDELSLLDEDSDFSEFPVRENDEGALLAPPHAGPPLLPHPPPPALIVIEELSDFFLLEDDAVSLLLENDSLALLVAALVPLDSLGWLGDGDHAVENTEL